ncbi:unnamed protein product [Ixodes pacificus]
MRCSMTWAWMAGSRMAFTLPRAPNMRRHRTTATSGSQPLTPPPARTLRLSVPGGTSASTAYALSLLAPSTSI